MNTVDQALAYICAATKNTTFEEVATNKAAGRALACDIFSPTDFPQFNNSAVDGFLLKSTWFANEHLPLRRKIAGIIAAGDSAKIADNLHTLRVMTGALVPAEYDAIVMQEQVLTEDDIALFSTPPKQGQHIRRQGEDLKRTEKIFSKGQLLGPAHIGLLLALGIKSVQVKRKLKVAIISTGSELIEAGEALALGQVYYCTGPMLAAQLQEYGADVVSIAKIPDDLSLTIAAINEARNADLLLLVGGMAVGRFDYGREALQQSGVEQIFFAGHWRPGKPLFFGKRNQQYVFGLPGNPVSCFVMNAVFVRVFLASVQGKNHESDWNFGRLKQSYDNTNGPDLFLRAVFNEENEIEILPGQGSHQLGSLAQAQALCHLKAGINYAREERVRVLRI